MSQCPGNDMSRWKPEDIAFVACPHCGHEVEIWKDEPARTCPACKKVVCNPSSKLDCEEWCSAADQCPGVKLKRSSEDKRDGG